MNRVGELGEKRAPFLSWDKVSKISYPLRDRKKA